MQSQLLDRYDVRRAILIPLEVQFRHLYGEYAEAFAAAVNEWLVDEWLDKDDRLYGSVSLPFEDAPRAVRELERATQHERFVKVLFLSTTREPLGHPKYWPIYEAAEAMGLPVGAHIAGFSGACRATGWGNYYFEYMVGYTQACQAQIVSLLASGVFLRFPTLKFIMEEQGVGWLPPLLWRLDRAWLGMKQHVPAIRSAPSETLRANIWVTTQPMDSPPRAIEVVELLDELGMDEHVMFSSDYPHFDFDDPGRVLRASAIGAERHRKIFSANAEAVYPFERRPGVQPERDLASG
jgi:hypothetical protein